MNMPLAHDETWAHAAPAPARADVVAPLTFIIPQAEKPVMHSQAYTGGEARYFYAVHKAEVPVRDMRPAADRFTLDEAGFALRRAPSAVTDFGDDRELETVYRPEVEALLKAETGAREVAIFDMTRRSDGGAGAANADGRRGAATRIHVDYTAASGPRRARDVLGAARVAALRAAGARIVQINLWRPVRGPVLRSPLALAEAGSVRQRDLVATDQIFPDRVGEIYHLAYRPDQRWWYAPGMTPDEALLIKGWDSAEDGRARFTPHTAFPLPDQTAETHARESIEARAFVVIGGGDA